MLHEEPFGPILTVAPFDTIEEAIEEANATDYGLAAYFFTAADNTKQALIGGLSAGALSVNYLKGFQQMRRMEALNRAGMDMKEASRRVRSFHSLKLVNGFGSFG
ncbi:aldehyde dehydrogenase family protein [Mesorhizobium sp. M0185]